MAMTPETVSVVVDELVLDGVALEDSLVRESLAQTLAAALAEQGPSSATGRVAAAVTDAVGREAAP
jgi:hypothetical protein